VNAAEIAAALGDAQREGRAWRCRCPLHGGFSLVLRDGDGGRVLVTCWGGCDRRDVLAELRRLRLFGVHTDYRPRAATPTRNDACDAARIARVLPIWHTGRPPSGTPVDRYLGGRGIEFETWPVTLRFHPRCPRPKDDTGANVSPLPAMVGLVEHAKRGPVAIHATYLRPDGSGKADIPKKLQKASFGPVRGGAVRFGMPCGGAWFAIAEGIETALAVATTCAIPAWAALSAGGIKNLMLPPEATHVVICADHDANGVGERAAHDAAERWLGEGRRVRLALPPELNTDFNDVLTKNTMGVGHVA
jgi:hypothetical protein